ncbi:NarK family nitrate/nitrite MFS transporter [Pollutibacter soli]|uniref:NarK family nitrate/nitrite MFS transporter n=1 Tax=Pollutibacter soli TaxID=3034157 RepID=UPI003013CF79
MSNQNTQQLSSLNIFSFKGIQMRTFHISWFTFFVCFFGWFGLAPLMPTIKEDLSLSKSQIGNIVIASVSGTIIARLVIGRLCDTWGPRKTYTGLLLIGAIPVMCVGLAKDYTSFLLFRLAISVIGASFVITQFHVSMMFKPNIKGTANAVAGGWGNLGGGITNMVMPLIFTAITIAGFTKAAAWRYAMIIPGALMLVMAFVYYRFTKDTPQGNFDEIHRDEQPSKKTDYSILKDWRIWALALAYGVCFGMEITFDNIAALHFVQEFKLSQQSAGFWAGVFGFMNIFARALGGISADKVGKRYGIRGKGLLLSLMLLLEGFGLMAFASAGSFGLAIVSMISFALFLKMANGATYAITPFINEKNVGLVSGIVGAGGNIGGMLFGFLFKSSNISYREAFYYIGLVVVIAAVAILFTRFRREEETEAATERETEVLESSLAFTGGK